MFGSLGLSELLVILVIVLLIFGAGKLPQIGDALGRSIKNFKRAASGDDEVDVTPRKKVATGRANRELDPPDYGPADEVEEADDAVAAASAKPAPKKR